jgi:ankyrin repeat protein
MEESASKSENIGDEYADGGTSTPPDRQEDSKMSLNLLKQSYEEKNLVLADEIISDMVSKSLVSGLKKIHTACGYGLPDLVKKYLEENKEDANCECSFNELHSITPLHFCAGIGPDALTNDRSKCIDLLAQYGAQINHLTSRNDTALHWATKLADLSVCKKLVELGIDVNKTNIDDCTCAHGAAFYKHLDILEMLIENRVNVNCKDISGKTVLHLLCKDSYDSATLASITSELNLASNEIKPTKSKLVQIVQKLLVEYKMDPNDQDLAEYSSLMYACEHEDIQLIQTLLEHKADLNVINKEGVTCMLLAIVNGCPRVVKFLLANGFNLNNIHAHCSYVTDAAYLNEIEILDALLDAGCDVNETKQDENGVILNPLWAACERSNLSVVELLLARGANPLIRPDLKMTALHCTAMAQYENLQIAKLLVEHKCPINLKSTQAGETPLFLACNSGYSDLVDYLIDLGVDTNDSSPMSRTCFQQAVFRGHRDVVCILINKGYVLTDDDKTDMNLYIMDLYQDNDVEMINFLLSKGLIDKHQILECIKNVFSYQSNQPRSSNDDQQQQLNEESIATLSNLKLDIDSSCNTFYPTTIEELDAFLSKNQNGAHFSDETEELK